MEQLPNATPSTSSQERFNCRWCNDKIGNKGGLVIHERFCVLRPGATPVKRPIDEEEQEHPETVPIEHVTKKGKSSKESTEASVMEEVANLLETTPCEPGPPETPQPKGKMETDDTPQKKVGRPKGSKTKKEKKKLTKKEVDSAFAAKPEDMGEADRDQDENSPTPEKAQVQVCRSIEGSCPTVFFAKGQTQPPRRLLPEDARVKQIVAKKPLTAQPEAVKETMDAAEREGLQAPAAWVGLGELPDDLPPDFRSLLVLGRSGSGKSTLLRALLKKQFPDYTGPLYPCGEWPEGRALIENFSSPEQGRACLTAVGLSSVPSWCKPYEVLSAGERYRANLALALQHRETHPDVPLVFDEWTSELDRDLAKVVSVAFSKRMRPKCKKVEQMKEGKKTDAEVESSKKEAEEDAEKQSVETTTVNEDAAEPTNADANADAKPDIGMEDASADAEPCADAPEDAEMQDKDGTGEDEDLAGSFEEELSEICEDDPVLEVPTGSKDEEATEGNRQAEDAEDAQASEVQSGGPYIFASCHEDVLEYLQPQYLILCESGAAPRLLKNPNEGKLPELASHLKGVTQPIRHHLVGSWLPGNKKLAPFIITHKGTAQPGIFKVHFEGGDRIDKLEKLADGSYVGNILPIKKLARFHSLDPKSLHIQLKGDKGYGTLMKATRRRMPAVHQALSLVDDPDAFLRNNKLSSPNYSDCRPDLLDCSGWYTPPEWGKDPLYLGLKRSGNPTLVRTIDFRNDARLEQVDDNQRYLATYVGETDGTLGVALENVSKLLDCPFTGLCTHRLDSLKLKNFQLGVITGPSGSGKSTMARDVFGPSPSITWLPGHSVLSHFSSLDVATDLLNAAFLDLHTAMRPYESLSGGEQARAHMARVLALETTKVLVLDEFTSLVDRPTAKRMAKGLQNLLNQRKLTTKIVVVSCHSDFVAKSFLEPDWLFETHNHRLLYFDGAEVSNAQRAKVAPLEQKLEDSKNKVLQTEKELDAFKSCMVQHAGHAFLSPVYRNGVAAFAGAWQVLSSQELAARKGEVEMLERELLQLRDEVAQMKEPEEPNDDEEPASLAELSSVPWTIPELTLVIRRALLREWAHFREHHYKDKSLNNNAVGFVGLLNGRACCFCAIVTESANWIAKSVQSGLEGNANNAKWTKIGYPTTWLPISGKRRMRRLFREHRTVVLPDFQGMGLASLMCDCLAVSLQMSNFDFTSQTVHPTYGGYRDRSPFWIPLPTNRNEKSALNGNLKYSHAFVGSFRPDGSQDEVLQDKLRRRVMMSENQVSVLLQTDIPELS